MASLDDAFASFVTEVKDVNPADEDSVPSSKRAKTAEGGQESHAATPHVPTEAAQAPAAPTTTAAVENATVDKPKQRQPAGSDATAAPPAHAPSSQPRPTVSMSIGVRPSHSSAGPMLADTRGSQPAVIGPAGPPPSSASGSSSSSSSSSSSLPVIGPAGPPPKKEHRGKDGADAQPKKAKRRDLRVAAGKVWVDPTLQEWPEDDFRLFVGDLAPEVDDRSLAGMFSEYESFVKARVVVDKTSGKSRGYGFVSMTDMMDAAKAIRDKNRKYLRSRPVTVRWSNWKKRSLQGMSNQQRKEEMRLVRAAKSINPELAHKQQRQKHKHT